VDAGSDTPSLVGKVLAWRKANASDADQLWTRLSAANEKVAELAGELGAEYERDQKTYVETVGRLTNLSGDDVGCFGWTAETDDSGHREMMLQMRLSSCSLN
jgi:phosphomevalonate kinase